MSAAERLFASKGYTRTSMADIAKAADVAVGTVYRLFPDKPRLLAALHAQMEARFIGAMRRGWAKKEPHADRFEPMIDALFDEAERVRETMPLYAMTRDVIGVADYAPGENMIRAIEEMHRGGVHAGAFRPVPSAIAAPIAHAMVEGGIKVWMTNPTPEHLRRVKTELTRIFRLAFAKARQSTSRR